MILSARRTAFGGRKNLIIFCCSYSITVSALLYFFHNEHLEVPIIMAVRWNCKSPKTCQDTKQCTLAFDTLYFTVKLTLGRRRCASLLFFDGIESGILDIAVTIAITNSWHKTRTSSNEDTRGVVCFYVLVIIIYNIYYLLYYVAKSKQNYHTGTVTDNVVVYNGTPVWYLWILVKYAPSLLI